MTIRRVGKGCGEKELFLTKAVLIIFWFTATFFSASTPIVLAQSSEASSCVTCHSDIWEEVKESIHGRQNISCHNCHGGDPTAKDKESAKGPNTGYIGIPDKKKIAETCGACHANVEVMNFYGVPTDQLARYKTSTHGKKLFLEANTKVAVCSDCHGYHDVLAITDPNSSVYPLNVPKTCNHCHGSEALMKPYGLPTDIFETYKKSVHGIALFEKKDISAATCVSCHGSHGAVPPGVKEISSACGKCHVNEKKYFLESMHAKPMAAGRFSECISCHGNHGVERASNDLYRTTCIKCHEKGSSEEKAGETIWQVFHQSGEKLKAAESSVKQASIEGIFVEEETGSLEEAKTNVIVMAPLQHSLSVERITELAAKFSEVADKITTQIHQKREALKWRKTALIPIWVFILAMAAALWVKYKRLKTERKKNQPNKTNREGEK
ncbi:MAG: hypothetical protein HY582_02115 [Candidatus Omnitrophica bacterium]|nr:hypothetical protein [Candidatus Omnitrophota bacterium]